MVVMTTISWADNNQNEQKSTSVKLILLHNEMKNRTKEPLTCLEAERRGKILCSDLQQFHKPLQSALKRGDATQWSTYPRPYSKMSYCQPLICCFSAVFN